MWNNKAATGNVASDEKIQRADRDLQHCSFHLSFILIVITGCDVEPYILIGTSGPRMLTRAQAVPRLLSTIGLITLRTWGGLRLAINHPRILEKNYETNP